MKLEEHDKKERIKTPEKREQNEIGHKCEDSKTQLKTVSSVLRYISVHVCWPHFSSVLNLQFLHLHPFPSFMFSSLLTVYFWTICLHNFTFTHVPKFYVPACSSNISLYSILASHPFFKFQWMPVLPIFLLLLNLTFISILEIYMRGCSSPFPFLPQFYVHVTSWKLCDYLSLPV